MGKRTFDKQYLRDVLWDDAPGKVCEEDYGSGRWESYHSLIFKADDDKFYSASFSRGLTEQQDVTPFEYDDDQIECPEVEQREKVVLEWVPVKDVPHE